MLKTTTAQEIIARKEEFLMPCLYHFYKDPPVIVRGEMQYLFDAEGARYRDMYAGVSVMNCGHANPAIIDAAIEQLRTLQHTTTIYLSEPMVALAEELINFIGGSFGKAFFVNSGSEANEGALLLSKLYTGRKGFIALEGGLHGRTALTMNLTGIPMWRTDPEVKDNVYFAPRPLCHKCQLKKTFPACGYACAQAIEGIIKEKGDIAAFIAEPIQGNGGIIVPPRGYFKRVREILNAHGVLFICDEVQTGFGRTGERFCFMHYGIEPDIVTCAKALGNGFPIGAFITRNEIAQCYTKPGASTTGGNQVSATAARAVLHFIEEHALIARSKELGAYFKQHLSGLAVAHDCVGDVRGIGLMLGVELERGGQALTAETDQVLEGLKDRGFLVGKTGLERNVLAFQPPLVIEQSDIDALIAALDKELSRI